MLSRIYSWFKVFNNAYLIYVISRTDPFFAIFIRFAIQRRKGAGNGNIFYGKRGNNYPLAFMTTVLRAGIPAGTIIPGIKGKS